MNRFILADYIIYSTSFSLSLENELTWDDSDWGSWENPDGKEDGAQVCIKRKIYSTKCHSKPVCYNFSVEDKSKNLEEFMYLSFPYKDNS